MKILTTSLNAQEIRVLPSVLTADVDVYIEQDILDVDQDSPIWNEDNGLWNEDYSLWQAISYIIDGDYLVINAFFTLKEGYYYDLTIKTLEGNIIYKDKIYCTDQEINQGQDKYYSVNKGKYKEYI